LVALKGFALTSNEFMMSVLSPAAELMRMLLPHVVEAVSDGGILARAQRKCKHRRKR
jgi:hypothetical protein